MRRSVILLALSFLGSKVFGLLRDILLARYFGAGNADPTLNLDVYYASFRIPDAIYQLLTAGVLSAGFIPMFAERLHRNTEEGNIFAQRVLVLTTYLLAIISTVLWIFMPTVVKMLFPELPVVHQNFTVEVSRILIIAPLFFGITSIVSGVNNVHKAFIGYAIAPILYNLAAIIGIVLFHSSLGIIGVAISVVVGAGLQLFIQIPEMIRSGFKFVKVTSLWNKDIRDLIYLSVPRVLTLSLQQGVSLLEVFFATALQTGSLSVMTYATNLQYVPIGIIALSSSVASFGELSLMKAQGDHSKFNDTIKLRLTMMIVILLPVSVLSWIMRDEIVALLFERGAFSHDSVIATGRLLGILAIGMIPTSCSLFMSRCFFALKNTKTPLIISIVSVITYVISTVTFIYIFGLKSATSLAYSVVIMNSFSAVFFYLYLRKALNISPLDMSELLKSLFAGLVSTLVIVLIKNNLSITSSKLDLLLVLTTITIGGLISHFLVLHFLKSRIAKKILTIRSR